MHRFTTDQIKSYLMTFSSSTNVLEVCKVISEEKILEANPTNKNFELEQTQENLYAYERQIGLFDLKSEQLELRRKTNGKEGKYWMALSPRWITEFSKKTDYKIFYWVNYGDDEVFGAFTVEQIIQWLSNPDLKLSSLGGTISGSRKSN